MIKVTIISPEAQLFCGEVDAIFLPGSVCPFEMLNDHAPIISALEEGDIRLRTGSKEEIIHIREGFVRSSRNDVRVCVEI